MAAPQIVSAAACTPGTGLIGILQARLRDLLPRFRKPSALFLRSSESAEEDVIACYGIVEIRQPRAGWVAETCVKGEPDRARATGLHRLASYVNGRNRGSVRLHALRPLVQTFDAPGRWRVRVGLRDVDDEILAASRNGKVRLRTLDAQRLAVIRVSGRPSSLAVRHAETALHLAIASTPWEAVGAPMLRLHALPAALPFLGRFEVAVAVAERTQAMSTEHLHPRCAKEPATQSCRPMH